MSVFCIGIEGDEEWSQEYLHLRRSGPWISTFVVVGEAVRYSVQ